MESEFGLLEVMRAAGKVLDLAGRVFYPHFCLGCGGEGRLLCGACFAGKAAPLRGLFFCPGCGEEARADGRCGARACRAAPLEFAASMAAYGDPVFRSLLQQYKYEGVLEAGELLTRCLEMFAERHRAALAPRFEGAVIVPVPLHAFRRAQRGFNQSVLFASTLARLFDRPVAEELLVKKFRWRSQAALGERERRLRNASGSVTVMPGVRMPRKVVLVDDVFTTGATLKACASVLKAAGTEQISAVTLLKG